MQDDEGQASLADTHAHLALPDFDRDLVAVLERARAAGVTRIIAVAIDLATARRSITLAEEHPGLYATAGLHPHAAEQWSPALEEELAELCRNPAVVAVGETGLDRVRGAPWEEQRRAFEAQLALAAWLGKPVIIHNREAGPDILACLDRVRPAPAGVMHCFTGDATLARACLERGLYISFAGIVTYRSGASLQDAVAVVPDDRLLLETDSPYLAPAPRRGQRNEPANLPLTAARVAAWRGQEPAALAALTTANAARLFGLETEH